MRPFPDPSILLHPQIPKPLHLMAPRVFLGDAWWNGVRREAYWRYGYRCHACGIVGSSTKSRSGLEAHEMYDIDYVTGRVEFLEAVALCHYCHNYIHMGRLTALHDKGEISDKFFTSVVRNGETVLRKAGIPIDVNEQVVELLSGLGKICVWGDYHMVIDGKRYDQRFKSFAEWSEHWEKQS